jgi:predicted peptidase
MVMAVLDKTRKEYKLDDSRLYLTGLSQGGHGTWAIGARHPDLFAAIAPICGYGDKSLAEKLGKMPVWSFHGDADTTVPLERSVEMDQWLKEAGTSPKLTVYPGVGHNSWDKAYREEDIGAWFLEHRK